MMTVVVTGGGGGATLTGGGFWTALVVVGFLLFGFVSRKDCGQTCEEKPSMSCKMTITSNR